MKLMLIAIILICFCIPHFVCEEKAGKEIEKKLESEKGWFHGFFDRIHKEAEDFGKWIKKLFESIFSSSTKDLDSVDNYPDNYQNTTETTMTVGNVTYVKRKTVYKKTTDHGVIFTVKEETMPVNSTEKAE